MQNCPDCQTWLEPFEVTCHKCGKVVSDEAVPIVVAAQADDSQLQDAFASWYKRGHEDLASGKYEEAAACFHEALHRCAGLESAPSPELKVRTSLVAALKKSWKLPEAAQQCKLIASLLEDEQEKLIWSKQCAELLKQADVMFTGSDAPDFTAVTPEAASFATLYCSSCRRVLSEAEVFAFRQGRSRQVRCLCGFEGIPLTKYDARYRQALADKQAAAGRKAVLLKVSSGQIEGGKQKVPAAILAFLGGQLGLHKLYLGRLWAFGICLLWTLTLTWQPFVRPLPPNVLLSSVIWAGAFAPWIAAIFEGLSYWQMSPVTFNLTFNIEQVLAQIPSELEAKAHDADLFSMEITDDPEDYIDELSSPQVKS